VSAVEKDVADEHVRRLTLSLQESVWTMVCLLHLHQSAAYGGPLGFYSPYSPDSGIWETGLLDLYRKFCIVFIVLTSNQDG
jgi:hypothetical protein